MRHLGKPLHLFQRKFLVVRVRVPPALGARVYDEHLKLVGKVVDVFGPVKSPYALVKLETGIKKLPKDLFFNGKTLRSKVKRK